MLKVIDPSSLTIPQNLIEILGPRSFRNPRTRENFISNTGVGFDYINASSAIINHVFTYMLNPERLNRVHQQNMFGRKILSLEDYLNEIQNLISSKYLAFPSFIAFFIKNCSFSLPFHIANISGSVGFPSVKSSPIFFPS